MKVGLTKWTKSKHSVGRCCASFPSQLLQSPLHLGLLLFSHYISLQQKWGVFIVWTSICWVLKWNLHFFFSLCRVWAGFFTGEKLVLWYIFPTSMNRGWRKTSDLVASFYSPLHPENTHSMQWKPISKESGKRHLLTATVFKQRLNRDTAGILSLVWGPHLNEDSLLQSFNN